MKKLKLTTIILSTAALSSCGLYSSYERPENIKTEELCGTINEAGYDSLPNWREMFQDAHLQVLIDSALKNNSDIRTADLKIQEAKATLHASKLAFLPSLSFDPTGTISSWDFNKATKSYSIPVDVSWQIDAFGSLRNAKERSKALYEQNKTSRQAVQTSLIANVANMYYTLLMLDEQLKLAQQTADSWKEYVDATKVMKEAGRMNEASVSQMEGTYYSICTQVEDIKASRTEVENTLCALLGETPHMIERGSIYDWKAPVDFISGIPVSLLGNRPDVKMAEHALAASFYTVNQSRAAFYPSINLSGMAGWTNSGGGMIIDPGKMLLSAVASLTQPIFARGEINAQYKISKAQYQEAEIQFQQTLLNAGAEINTTLAQLQNANNKRNLYEKQVESLERAVESTKLLMQNSSTTYLEVLTAVQTLLSAQLSQISNYNDEIQNTISLYQSLGGGVE